MKYDDGSIANIHYFANGSESLAKEYMEIHVDGNSIQMNDYKSLKINGELLSSFSSDRSIKGHIEELNVLYEAIIRGERPTPVEQLFETTLASIQLSKI